jgi:hypothetical protein
MVKIKLKMECPLKNYSLIGEECRPCPFFASYTLAFALQLKKKARENLSQGSRRVPVNSTFGAKISYGSKKK